MSDNYDVNSIGTLSFFDAIRKMPGVYIGSKDAEGLHHLVKEVVSNSIDEFLNGAGSLVNITIKKDGSILISDNGRGIPIGKKKGETKTALQICFTEQHGGGKFLNATGESGYNSSGGQHGLGVKCVNALSDKLLVVNHREGKEETLYFEDGKEIKHETKKYTKNDSGLSVQFYPSLKYLETNEFNYKKLVDMIKEFSFLCPGLKFIISDERIDKTEEFYSEQGLYDFIKYLNKEKDFLFDPVYINNSTGNFQVEIAVGYNNSYGSLVKLYTNNIPQEKGTHLTGFKTAWTSCLNQFARDKGWLKEKDNNLTGADYEEGQILILNFKMIDPVFKGQNKEELSSSEGRVVVQQLTTQALNEYFTLHEREIKIVVDKALKARNVREAAKKAREAARELNGKKNGKKILNLPSKLIDAYSKKRNDCELLIVEGDSAAGNLVEARNPETMAIFPIRGKIISVYKNSREKIFANQEVVNIIKALGLETDPKTGKMIYDKSKLRYGKIVLCADADPDGQAIKNLLLELFWWLCPELVKNGHVYAAVPPLFRITTKKNKYIFLKDQKALEEYKEVHQGESYLVNRNKGLGEQDASELREAIIDEKTRNIVQIVVENEKEADDLMECLMGTSVPPRREYLLKHSEEAKLE